MAYENSFEVRVFGIIDLTMLANDLKAMSGWWFYDHRGTLKANHIAWHECPEHMGTLAERFPDVTFMVTRFGEEPDDVWRYFYRHGHEPVSQRGHLEFDPAPDWAGGTP